MAMADAAAIRQRLAHPSNRCSAPQCVALDWIGTSLEYRTDRAICALRFRALLRVAVEAA
jgi:hypothetical protein